MRAASWAKNRMVWLSAAADHIGASWNGGSPVSGIRVRADSGIACVEKWVIVMRARPTSSHPDHLLQVAAGRSPDPAQGAPGRGDRWGPGVGELLGDRGRVQKLVLGELLDVNPVAAGQRVVAAD